MEITPVERVGNVFVKRDDLFVYAGVNGVKARTTLALINGAKGVVTAGVRNTSQGIVVASIAQAKGLPCYVFVPQGKRTVEMEAMEQAGAIITQVPYGYKSVVNARARDFALSNNYVYVPHSMEHTASITSIAPQLINLPAEVKRIVVPCGSGMTMAGILHAVKNGGHNVQVLGVGVGGKVEPRLDKFGPQNWREFAEVIYSPLKYEKWAPNVYGHITLDPVYEAKALPYLKDGDMLWVTGIRKTLTEGL